MTPGVGDRERDPGKTRARSDVDRRTGWKRADEREQPQGVLDVTLLEPLEIPGSDEIEPGRPFPDEGAVRQQLRARQTIYVR